MGVKRKYESERRSYKETEDVRDKRVKKSRYDRRKQRVSVTIIIVCILIYCPI